MAGPVEAPGARRAGALGGLSTGWTTFLVVDAILVVTFLVLVVMQVVNNPPGGGSPAASGATTSVSSEPETTPDATVPEAPSENQALTDFRLPSGNIWCSMTETSVTCTISQFTFAAPTTPPGCTGTVGQVFSLTAAEGPTLPCVTTAPARPADAPVLEYGQASTIGEMTCHSSRNGATCRHDPTGVGFSVARSGYTLF